MAISFSDCIDCSSLHDAWRARLLEAERRFTQNQNDESRAEYMRILKIFKDLVLYGILPREKGVGTPDPRICATRSPPVSGGGSKTDAQ